ncbi:hypothetical protein EJ04DRAFT_516624 [Polyplosphaeria fusca]|uniref:FAD-binding FR-type domain-containing protein n=1 Tax=Polyplosphaeria fusca TaxID=682080 RepID=A0A9P4QML9_9PLEO|nr:hypothetical protein EJ04DRAFT_516624 [Polyplosphaeria fusca]
MAFSMAMDWNEGEVKMHNLLRVDGWDNPTSTMLTPQASFLLQRAPLLAFGTLDSQDRPWTTLWGGQPGFSEALGGGIIGTRTFVDAINDPVVQALVGGTEKGEMRSGNEKMLSGLTIDLMTRKRVKIAGRMLAGALSEVEVEYEGGVKHAENAPEQQNQLQLVYKVDQSLGNCPKYLNQYEIQPALTTSKLVEQSPNLSNEAKALIAKSDMFFLSTSTEDDMDTNHRGGPTGFVRIVSDTEIAYPEYSGNRLYQSLGNLQMNPKIGITFPDYETGEILYITGTTEILVLEDAAKLLPGSNLAVKIKIDEARLVEGGLPFRGTRKIPSPYNPLVRALVSEGNVKSSVHGSGSQRTVRLTKKTRVTPTVSRFAFSIPDGLAYSPGQWAAFDFSEDMDIGYSHMRDDDPRSLNDDFVRTFTISSTPSSDGSADKEFEITIREVGAVTNFLFKQNDRAGFEVPLLGVGGEFKIQQDEGKLTPFVAGGVGITPLLGHLPHLSLDPQKLRLLWTVRHTDVDLVADTLRQWPALAKCTAVYFTGTDAPNDMQQKIVELELLGAMVERRRIEKRDLDAVAADTWYLCAAKPLRKSVLNWLPGKKVLFEDFDY